MTFRQICDFDYPLVECRKCNDSSSFYNACVDDNSTNGGSTFKIIHQNIRSYHRNFDEFLVLIQDLKVKFNCIILTEAWLNNNSDLMHIEGYNMFRSFDSLNNNDGIVNSLSVSCAQLCLGGVASIMIDAKELLQGPTGVVYDDRMVENRCLWDSNYQECPGRFTKVMERCRELGLLDRCRFIPSREATEEEILSLHKQEHLDKLKATDGCSDIDKLELLSSQYDAIYIHPMSYRLSLLSVGSTIQLVDEIVKGNVQNGMAIIRPPGHHAMKNEYCGYCYFNNVAIAAEHALNNLGLSRILIVDWDVHHGQATQQMFFSDPRVLYFSIHRYELGEFWPNLRESDFDYIGEGEGKGFNFNVPLNKTGMTNADYLAIFHQVLLPVATEFQPELIIVSAGYDAAVGCPEGEMEVTPACYAHLLASLAGLASGKVAVVLEILI